MNEQQQQKAIEALNIQKDRERKQRLAMMFHLAAYTKLHCMGVLLPYRVLYNLEKSEHDKTFAEVPPNPYYPNPAITLETMWSRPSAPIDKKGLPINEHGFPDLTADEDFQKKLAEYKQKEAAEKMPIEKWGYYYARFLLPYDLSSFTDFDYWGKKPESTEEKEIISHLRAACLEAWRDCKAHPENYNFEPIQRLEAHKTKFDVGYGYI